MQERGDHDGRPGSSVTGLAAPLGRRRSPIGLFLVLLLTWASAASSQSPLQPQSASIFFRSSSFIGVYTPGQSGYRTIVPPRAQGWLGWMQLVPGPARIYWSEVRVGPSSTLVTSFWSARADGSDVRPEPDLADSEIGPSGSWKYHVDVATNQYARSRLDGSEEQLLGFGPPVFGDRTPFVDPNEEWIYYFAAELSPPPGTPNPRLALLRGNIGTGTVQQLLIPGARGVGSFRDLRLVFDPANNRVHVMCGNGIIHDEQFPTADSMLYRFDASTFALVASRAFAEGEGAPPRFAIAPASRDYYFTDAGGVSSPQPLRQLRYADLAIHGPPAPIVLDDPAVGLIFQLDANPAINVPEPDGTLAGWIAVGWMVALPRWWVARGRRLRHASRSLSRSA